MKKDEMIALGMAVLAAYLITRKRAPVVIGSMTPAIKGSSYWNTWMSLGIDPNVNYSSSALGGQNW